MADSLPFDPNAAADLSSGVFGLPFTRDQAAVIIIPVPYEATVSYGGGTEAGPEAVRVASAQVDLLDRRFGEAWHAGLFMEDADPRFCEWGRAARKLAQPIIEQGGATPDDAPTVAEIDAICASVNDLVRERAAAALAEGKVPCLLGGEHAVSLGAIRACAEARGEIGILQIDAHMDLRDAFEGFRYSHASVMHNALQEIPGVARLVQVGIRDFSKGETDYAASLGDRVFTHYDDDLFDAQARGESFATSCARIVSQLPDKVYLTFDIDGLDPALCPNTGTPVPGGLGFREASLLLHTLAKSGKQIVGCDLVEVAPAPAADDADDADTDADADTTADPTNEWDANVGARILFRLCMAAIISQGH